MNASSLLREIADRVMSEARNGSRMRVIDHLYDIGPKDDVIDKAGMALKLSLSMMPNMPYTNKRWAEGVGPFALLPIILNKSSEVSRKLCDAARLAEAGG